MIGRTILSLLITAGASLSVAAVAQEREPTEAFQPDGKWRLNSLADGCSVARDFTRGDERVTFSIKRIHPRSAVQFAVIGAPVFQRSVSLEAGFLPAENLQHFDRVAEASIGEREGVVFAGRLIPRPEEGNARLEESEVTDFVVIDPRNVRTTLHTRAIDKAVAALDACVTRKLLEFGFDLEGHRELSKHVTPKDLAEWAPKIQRNYPPEALRSSRHGAVPLRLIIDETGRVTHCHATNFLTAKVLRDAACEGMIEHARFNPARDAEGNPAKDFTFQSIRYAIAESPFSADAHGFAIPHNRSSGKPAD